MGRLGQAGHTLLTSHTADPHVWRAANGPLRTQTGTRKRVQQTARLGAALVEPGAQGSSNGSGKAATSTGRGHSSSSDGSRGTRGMDKAIGQARGRLTGTGMGTGPGLTSRQGVTGKAKGKGTTGCRAMSTATAIHRNFTTGTVVASLRAWRSPGVGLSRQGGRAGKTELRDERCCW